MDSTSEPIPVMECKVSFHDRSHLKIADTKQNGDLVADLKMREGLTTCFITFEKNELAFLANSTDQKPFCWFQPTNMSIEIDRNAQ